MLGIRSDSNSGDATAAFAKASRRLKRISSSPFGIEELTSALSRIESSAGHNHSWFSIPCNPSALRVDLPVAFNGSHIETVAQIQEVVDGFRESPQNEWVAELALRGALEATLAWDWAVGTSLSMEVLRHSSDEALRDEALNTASACYLMMGESARALDALKHAVQGDWNLPLQNNLAIVATSEDPSLAAEQMRFLIDGAPTGQERLSAALRAIDLWRTTQEQLTGSSDSDEHAPLPAPLASAIENLLSANDLTEQEFFQIGNFIAGLRGSDFLTSPAFAASKHRDSASAELISYRAAGFGEYLNNLVRVARRSKPSSPWLDEEVEEAVQSVLRLLVSDDDTIGAALGFNFMEQGLDCDKPSRLLLFGLTTIAAASGLSEGEALNDNFTDWMLMARRSLSKFDSEDDEFLREAVDRACWILAAQHHDQIANMVRQMAPAVGRVQHQMGGPLRRLSANKAVVAEISQTVVSFAQTARPQIAKLIQLVTDDELKTSLVRLGSTLEEFQNAVKRFA